jgi:hypothetical protein
MLFPNTEQIELMDKILLLTKERIVNRIGTTRGSIKELAEKFNVSRDLAENAVKKVCEIGKQEELLGYRQMGYGYYEITSVDQIEVENFIRRGGFKEYFQQISNCENDISNIFVLNNSGTFCNVNQSINSIAEKTPISQMFNSPIETKSKIRRNLELVSWIIGIIGVLFSIYVFFIKH